ncbi:bec2a6cd-4836-4a5c-a042-d47a2e447ce5 [Sclerotinia trifoliorum]|uniref:Bec2a6cd-4836-4a5c-a042-d47a2e447ce5 n=1 Tax=Sclerotinia trifoliorum TaxID=28548 RepID=A0A8H2ZNK4_9HELO|nr:bec2a6cd-4836-4a5c-a042-d47a2e447ce5 [Sclerotinia trifoliorum]
MSEENKRAKTHYSRYPKRRQAMGPQEVAALVADAEPPLPQTIINNHHHHFHLTVHNGDGFTEEERDLLRFRNDMREAENFRFSSLQMQELSRRITELERFSLQQNERWRL